MRTALFRRTWLAASAALLFSAQQGAETLPVVSPIFGDHMVLQRGKLFNGTGMPAVPFRTDNWPGITAGRTRHDF